MPSGARVEAVAVVGLGKLGAPLAALLAEAGFDTVGVDVAEAAVDAINAGRAPVDEPGLAELIAKVRPRLSATTDTRAAARTAQTIFIVVPTPSLPDGRFDPGAVAEAIAEIGAAVRDSGEPRLIVITSTLSPGDTDRVMVPALQKSIGKIVGHGIGLCYSPEFIALGSVLNDMRSPDFLLIGESDPVSGQRLESIYARLCPGPPPVARMNFFEAELAKLAVNNFVTMRISFANHLARICDLAGGADVDAVTRAIGLDTRIGPKYLRGALSYGGPCFPRDTVAFERLARDLGIDAPLSAATEALNGSHLDHIAGRVSAAAGPGGTVAVLGLAYKPDTAVLDASPSLGLIDRLVTAGHPVVAHDPAVRSGASLPASGVRFEADVETCTGQAKTIVVATPWPQYASLRVGDRPVTLFDPWRIVDPANIGAGADIRYIGRGDDMQNAEQCSAMNQ